MSEGALIFIPFNAKPDSGLDYAPKTMEILGRRHTVYGLALGDPITYRDIFRGRILRKRVFVKRKGYGFFRPVFVIPGQRFTVIREINYALAAFILASLFAVVFRKKKKILWYFEPFHIPRMLPIFTGYVTVYDCVDFFPGFSGYAKRCHDLAIRTADSVFVNSQTLKRKFADVRPDIRVVPLGFDPGTFVNRSIGITKRKTGFVVGYAGGINFRLDYNLLLSAIPRLSSVTFVFVGDVEKNVFETEPGLEKHIRQLFSLPNVRHLPQVTKSGLGASLQTFDAFLIPYDISGAFNRYCYPMKLMEYFYFGKPVISTAVDEVRKFERTGIVRIMGSAEEFVSIVKSLRKNGWPDKLGRIQKSVALENTWNRKVGEMLRHIRMERKRSS